MYFPDQVILPSPPVTYPAERQINEKSTSTDLELAVTWKSSFPRPLEPPVPNTACQRVKIMYDKLSGFAAWTTSNLTRCKTTCRALKLLRILQTVQGAPTERSH